MQSKGEVQRRESRLEKGMLARKGYLCRGLLGEGTFSRVYWVEAVSGGKSFACKVSENKKILEQEAQVLALLEHPLFPKYFDFWKEGGRGFLLRECVPGSCLEEMLGRRGHFSTRQTIYMGLELARGLGYLHERQERFLFRDLKPANIVLRQDGRLKLVDLGCVCSLNEEIFSRAGSPGFAAPEQLRSGGVLTPASDVYGLGQTLKAALGEEKIEQPETVEAGMKRGFFDDIFLKHGFAGKRKRKEPIWRQKVIQARLLRVLDACTQEEAWKRIPDMESLEGKLQELIEKSL